MAPFHNFFTPKNFGWILPYCQYFAEYSQRQNVAGQWNRRKVKLFRLMAPFHNFFTPKNFGWILPYCQYFAEYSQRQNVAGQWNRRKVKLFRLMAPFHNFFTPKNFGLGPVRTTRNFACFAKKPVNAKPFSVRTIFFVHENFVKRHQTSKTPSSSFGGLQFFVKRENLLFRDSYPSTGHHIS